MARIDEVAKTIYQSHGDTPEAVNLMRDEILRDPEMMQLAAKMAAVEAIGNGRRELRNQITNGKPKLVTPEARQRMQRIAATYYNWPLMDGTPIGDATRDLLLRDSERFQRNAEGNARNANFLRMVADKVRDGQTVKEALSEDQLEKLMEKAKRASLGD